MSCVCPSFDPSKGNWCRTEQKNPTCADSGPDGKLIPCCSSNSQCSSGICDQNTRRCKGWCNSDVDCDTDLVCKNNACITSTPSGGGGAMIPASKRPTEEEFNSLASKLNMPRPALNKSSSNGPRPYRLTLWHEGVVGIDGNNNLKNYFRDMITFINYKKFDRVFFQLADPKLTDNYGSKKFPYADPNFVIQNMLKPLSSNANIELGALLDVDPSYLWSYDMSLPGGIFGNNPDYTNTGDCSNPYRKCDINNPSANCAEGGSTCSANNNKCDGGTCCLNYPPGCPNNLEQAFKYIGEINTLAKSMGVRPITTIAFDGEDFAHYGADKYGMIQAWQAASKYAPDVNEIGYAKAQGTNPGDNMTNAAYPEIYWIGELKPTDTGVGCSGCKNQQSDDIGCTNCTKAIYQTYINDPQGMLNAFSPLLDKYSSHWSDPGCCPLISIEHFHPKNGYDTCVQKFYDPTGFCGTFDGFGDWDWDKFEEFLTLFCKKYNVKEIGVYEWQFVPPQWMPGGKFNSGSGTITENLINIFDFESKPLYKNIWFWVAIVIALLILIALYKKFKSSS